MKAITVKEKTYPCATEEWALKTDVITVGDLETITILDGPRNRHYLAEFNKTIFIISERSLRLTKIDTEAK